MVKISPKGESPLQQKYKDKVLHKNVKAEPQRDEHLAREKLAVSRRRPKRAVSSRVHRITTVAFTL